MGRQAETSCVEGFLLGSPPHRPTKFALVSGSTASGTGTLGVQYQVVGKTTKTRNNKEVPRHGKQSIWKPASPLCRRTDCYPFLVLHTDPFPPLVQDMFDLYWHPPHPCCPGDDPDRNLPSEIYGFALAPAQIRGSSFGLWQGLSAGRIIPARTIPHYLGLRLCQSVWVRLAWGIRLMPPQEFWDHRVENRARRILSILATWEWEVAWWNAWSWGINLVPLPIHARLGNERWGVDFRRWRALVLWWASDEAVAYW